MCIKKSGIALFLAVVLGGIYFYPYTPDAAMSFKKNEVDTLGLPAMKVPENNPITKEKVVLGRKLFMDRRLSHNNTISCAMCHVPEQGFTVNELATAVGIEGGTGRRNAPTMLNVGFSKHLFHDGRENTLENQMITPLLAENEMGNPSIGYVLEKINSFKDYDGMFERAFDGRKPDLQAMGQAIASYERTLVSGNSKFDQWYYKHKQEALNTSEINGFKIFTGKAQCVACHTVTKENTLFTDSLFHNTGAGWSRNNKVVDENDRNEVDFARGVKVDIHHFDKTSEEPKNDIGRFEVTKNPADSWFYNTPTLRNIALTAPYMHDGSLATLESVVDFYNNGGEENPYKDVRLVPLGLTESEKKDLVAFLKSLTGSNAKRLEKEARAAYFEMPVP